MAGTRSDRTISPKGEGGGGGGRRRNRLISSDMSILNDDGMVAHLVARLSSI